MNRLVFRSRARDRRSSHARIDALDPDRLLTVLAAGGATLIILGLVAVTLAGRWRAAAAAPRERAPASDEQRDPEEPGERRRGWELPTDWSEPVPAGAGPGRPGALVVDSARLDDGYPAIDFFERTRLPFVVAVNAFDGRLAHDLGAIQWALAIGDHVPLVQFDARDRLSVRDAPLILLDRALERAIRERDS